MGLDASADGGQEPPGKGLDAAQGAWAARPPPGRWAAGHARQWLRAAREPRRRTACASAASPGDGQRTLAADEPQHARQLLREALALWRGPPLTGLEYEIRPTRDRDEGAAGWPTLEAWADAGLALGEHAQLIAELESLVREHPLRERYCAQLMVALPLRQASRRLVRIPSNSRSPLGRSSASNPGRSCAGSSGRSSVRIRGSTRPSPPRPAPGLPSVQRACPSGTPAPERALLVVPSGPESAAALLGVAEPMAKSPPARELIIAVVVEPHELREATAALATHRSALLEHGVAGRTAASRLRRRATTWFDLPPRAVSTCCSGRRGTTRSTAPPG